MIFPLSRWRKYFFYCSQAVSVKGAREENSGYFKVFSYNVAMFQQNFTQNRPKPRLCQTCRSRTVTFWRVPMSSYLKLIRERRRRERRKFEDFEETSLKVISNELFAGEACTPSNQSRSIHPVRVLEGVTTSRGSYTPSRFSAPSRRMYFTHCSVLKGSLLCIFSKSECVIIAIPFDAQKSQVLDWMLTDWS